MAWESALAGAVFHGYLLSLKDAQAGGQQYDPSPEKDKQHTETDFTDMNSNSESESASAAAIALLHHVLGAFVRTRYFSFRCTPH